MRYIITLLTILTILWSFLSFGMKTANANEYNETVVGHVIQTTINGTSADTSKILEAELQKLAHQFTLESLSILQTYLPSIIDGVMAELRLKTDKEYKCALLKGSKIEDDCK